MANAFLPSSERAGVAIQVHGLANALARRGHDVTMFTCSPACTDALYATHTFAVDPRLRRRLYSFAQAALLARTDFSSFDVVHAHGDNYLLFRWPAQVRTFHGSAKAEASVATRLAQKLYYRGIVPLEWLGSRVAAYDVGVSEATRTSIGHVDEVIPCGIDLARFGAGEKSSVPSILFVGGLSGRKRGRLLVETFLREVRPLHPSAELWLVSGERVAADGVLNLGHVPDERLADLYRQAWVFCMPSAYEGFGVPYIEAMASGTPAVATANPGADEVLAGGRYGEIVSEATLGTTLSRLIADGARRAHFAQAGLERAKTFDWDIVAARYERVYASTASRRPNLVQRFFRHISRPGA